MTAIDNLSDSSLFRTRAHVNGHWIDALNGAVIEVADPATGDVLGTVPNCGAEETRAAIGTAEAAFPAWRGKTAGERAGIMMQWYELMIAHRDDLAAIMTAEQGKPLAESLGEINYGASYIKWFAEEARRVYGEIVPPHVSDRRIFVNREPIGVAAAITPWNFPNAMIARKAGAALAAGCTMVVKPSELTPYSALAMAELGQRAGLPEGVFSVVTGDAEAIGGEITSNPTVRKLSFTGSTRVGKMLMAQCAETVKRLSMELGGNAPFIVFDDADLDIAIPGVIASKFRNAGQTCVCANRILVQDGIYDAFAERLTEEVKKLSVGSGFDEDTRIGPLINTAAMDKVESIVADALARDAKLTTGGTRHKAGDQFYTPTVLTGATQKMRVAHEEIFGPVAPLFRFSTDEEAVAMANDTPNGLSSYMFTENISRAFRVSEAIEFGMVGVNTGLLSTELSPFGGVKEAGFGREGSKHGIEDYLNIKAVHFGNV